MRLNEYQMTGISIISAALDIAFGTDIGPGAAGVIAEVATECYNNGWNNIYGTFQKLINNQCNILTRRRVKYNYGSYNGTAFSGNPYDAGHAWEGSPWDYTQPSACRELVNSYSY